MPGILPLLTTVEDCRSGLEGDLDSILLRIVFIDTPGSEVAVWRVLSSCEAILAVVDGDLWL